MAGWKLSTFLFAGATLLLLGRDLLRQDHVARLGTGRHEPAAPRAQSPPEPVVAAPPAPPTEAEPSLPPPPPAPPPPGAAADELAYTLLVWGPARTWEERLALLEPRRDEVVPVLEDWIARAQEIYAAGGSLQDALVAYARLMGRGAVPALERLAIDHDRERAGRDAVQALTWAEDPAATEAILRLQARMPPESLLISCFDLMGRTKAAENVVHAWESTPFRRADARLALFLMGTPEDRERVWEAADRDERRILLQRIGYAWTGWSRSILETAAQFAGSEDPLDRIAGMCVVLRHPEAFPPATVALAERALEADLAAPPASLRKSLDWIHTEWDARRKSAEQRERIRAALIR